MIRDRLIEIFEENQQELGEDIGVGASMYGVMADQILNEFLLQKRKMGTVEPIHTDYDELTIAFIVGAIEKYADKPDMHSELVDYLKERCLTD